ncbi:MAG: helix-turn-helix domain-containing protein, partial [Gemmatimonadota bacterium]|nr:helix-turn-helix domain-containing protein [Gemmatimonadota bacterium]
MNTRELPPEPVMMQAFLNRDSTYDGVFFTGVHTTGIFCRPTCPARKPRPDNISFFAAASEALSAGFRPCLRCRPLERQGSVPTWLRPLLDDVDADPARRWTDQDMRARGLNPERVRRWFKKHHGMTFHSYSRARRLGAALGSVQKGSGVSRAAFEVGYDSLSGFQEAFRRYFGAAPTSVGGEQVARVSRITTPLGPMLVAVTSDAVCLLEFTDRRGLPGQVKRIAERIGLVFTPGSTDLTHEVERQVEEYFEGRRTRFDFATQTAGTEFQQEVWEALTRVP